MSNAERFLNMQNFTAEVTGADVLCVVLARDHYRAFAEAAERQGEQRTADIMRKQEFRADRFLVRLGIDPDSPEGGTP